MIPGMGRHRAAVPALVALSCALAPASASAASGGAAVPTDGVPSAARASARTGGAPARATPPPPAHRLTRARFTPPVHAVSSRFPVAGPHSYGGADARFGASRSGHVHQGQDVLAAEGTPLLAPVGGRVTSRGDQPRGAGLYLVLRAAASGRDYVFMHLRPGSLLVAAGEAVRVGQLLAQVGHSGDAQGPHLHLEVWVGGWGARGGHPVDPRPTLRRWER